VGEGFVNAVKHSAARTVRLSVTGGPGAVTVAVSSPGQLGAVRTPGLGLASFGDRARLRQDGEDVVLEVIVPAD
jgi:signal transduction histidine kinase